MARSDYTPPTFVNVPNPASPPNGAPALDVGNVNALVQAVASSVPLTADATIGGIKTFTGTTRFTSGTPWFDVDAQSGATDDAKLQAAINSATTVINNLGIGCEIRFTPGKTYLWSGSVPTVPRNLPARMKIVADGAYIKLTTSAPRFLDPLFVAQHDTFQNIHLSGYGAVIDCNNLASNDHVIFGTWTAGSYHGGMQFKNLTIEGFTTVNVPTDYNATGTYTGLRQNIVLNSFYNTSSFVQRTAGVTAGSATVTDTTVVAGDAGKAVYGVGIPLGALVGTVTAGSSFTLVNSAGQPVAALASGSYRISLGSFTILDRVTNVRFRDLTLGGGNIGIAITANVGDGQHSAPMWIDDVLIERCSHDTGAVPTKFATCANFFIGNNAYGDRLTIRDCHGRNSGDVGYEVDNMQNAWLVRCSSVDAATTGFYTMTAAPMVDLRNASLAYEACTASHLSLGTTAGTPGRGFEFDGASYNNPLPAIKLRDCRYRRVGNAWQDSNTQAPESLWLHGPATSLSVSDMRDSYESYVLAAGSTSLQGWGAAIEPTNSPDFRFTWRDWYVTISGVQTTPTTAYRRWMPLVINPASDSTVMTWQGDGYYVNHQQTYSGGAVFGTGHLLYLGSSAGAHQFGVLRRFVVTGIGVDDSIQGVLVNTGALAAGSLTIEDSDTHLVGGTEVSVPGTSDAANIRVINHRWSTFPRPATSVTVGASPFAYQNVSMVDSLLVVRGGTVSQIEYSVDGSAWTVTGMTQGPVPLRAGHFARIAYTAAPTVTLVPVS